MDWREIADIIISFLFKTKQEHKTCNYTSEDSLASKTHLISVSGHGLVVDGRERCETEVRNAKPLIRFLRKLTFAGKHISVNMAFKKSSSVLMLNSKNQSSFTFYSSLPFQGLPEPVIVYCNDIFAY